MIDRVGDGGRDTDNADLAHAFDAERIETCLLLDEDDVDVVHVGVHRHVVSAKL